MAIPANMGITDIIHTLLQHCFSETALYGSLLPGRIAAEQNETNQSSYQSNRGPSEASLLITLPLSTGKNLVLRSGVVKGEKTDRKEEEENEAMYRKRRSRAALPQANGEGELEV